MDRDGSQRAVTFVSSQHVGDRVLSFTLFVVMLFYNEEYCYTSFTCLFVLFAGRRDPSRVLAVRYGLGVLDMYVLT